MSQQPDQPSPSERSTRVERTSERELRVTRMFDAPVHAVFRAWTIPELFMRWWAPKSMGVPMRSCEMDVRDGGGYKIEFGLEGGQSMAFFGKYLEVIADARLVWTNDETEQGAVTTVTFEERDGRTLLTYHETYASKDALDEALRGMDEVMPEQFGQLDELLAQAG